MSKFKVGDKVKRVAPSDILKVGEIYTIAELINGPSIKIEGSNSYFDEVYFELATDNETIRKEITDAVETLEEYGVDVLPKSPARTYTIVDKANGNASTRLANFLDKHYPLKTPEQLEIESIRKEQEKLAARLKELEK